MSTNARIVRVLPIIIFAAALTACDDAKKRVENTSALTLGLNRIDPAHYHGDDGKLSACESDAKDMARILRDRGIPTDTLLSRRATRAAVTTHIESAAARLTEGGLFVLTYAGHGSQLPDSKERPDEDDLADETWCLYDGQFRDDELYDLLTRFRPGVRVLVVSDSCHSGTVIRLLGDDFVGIGEVRRRELMDADAAMAAVPQGVRGSRPAVRVLPLETAVDTYAQHRGFYDAIGERAPPEGSIPLQASVLLLSGCEDDQTSADGHRNGLFTEVLKSTWDGGRFEGDYEALHSIVRPRVAERRRAMLTLPGDQEPAWLFIGVPWPEFVAQRPFDPLSPTLPQSPPQDQEAE